MLNLRYLLVVAGFSGLSLSPALDALAPQAAPSKAATQNSALIKQISLEPTLDEQAATLQWSPDGAEVAWMHLVRPDQGKRERDVKLNIQQEILGISAKSDSSTDPAIIVPAPKISEILRASGPPIHIRPDDDEEKNPYRLQGFLWSRDRASLLMIGLHSLTWFEIATGHAKTLVSTDDTLSDVALSPDGKNVIFLRDHQMWMVDAGGKAARLLATPHREGIADGELDWPYRNELHLPRGYWWSPQSTAIAYIETDDRLVDKYALRASDGSERAIVYPKPGGKLPLASVWVKRFAGGAPIKIALGNTNDLYIPRVQWLPDGRHLAIERLDRHQQKLELLLADAVTGKTSIILTETDKYWINLNDDLRFLRDGKRFLWGSERNDFHHLYLYDLEGKQLAQITKGDWEVTSIDAVDEANGLIYFTSTEKSLLERHLYRVALDGSGMTRVSEKPGTHTVHFSPDHTSLIDIFSNTTTPPHPELIRLGANLAAKSDSQPATVSNSASAAPSTGPASVMSPNKLAADAATAAPPQPVEFLNLKLHQGLPVHAFMIKPPAFDSTRKYPVIVYLAGGPGEQMVRDAWAGTTGMWMQLMAQNGYIVFALDNQGTAGRGHYFEEPIHLRLGGIELADQRDGVQYLSTLPYVDTQRLGVCGWGYGGFLAIHAMLDRPLPYKAGFAGAPITDWHLYDAVFGERYLDDTVTHADGWDASTSLENAPFLKGALLLAQGTDDEFVHIENLLTMQDEFVDAGKSADILLLPDRGHQIEDPSGKTVLFTRMTDFFLKNL